MLWIACSIDSNGHGVSMVFRTMSGGSNSAFFSTQVDGVEVLVERADEYDAIGNAGRAMDSVTVPDRSTGS